MQGLLAPLMLTLVVLMQPTTRASAPSPQQLEQWKNHERQVKEKQERALPWKSALENAFSKESTEVVRFIFLTTYKHHVPDSGMPPKGDEKPAAEAFFKAWKKAKAACAKAGLQPLELAEAIYRFTNSDWAPVSVATGPGLDKVASAKDYEKWATAAIAAGRKARKGGLAPASVWSDQAASYQVQEPKDIAKVGLTPPRPRH